MFVGLTSVDLDFGSAGAVSLASSYALSLLLFQSGQKHSNSRNRPFPIQGLVDMICSYSGIVLSWIWDITHC